jgi:HlyD family secretion protein
MMKSSNGRTAGATVGGISAVLAAVLFAGCAPEDGTIAGTGTVEGREVTVSAQTSGEILEMAVEEGTEVERGALLATLNEEQLRLREQQARASVTLAEAQLSLLLEGAAPEDVRQAEEAVSQAREEFELARREFERVAQLHEAGSVSRSEYDRAQARLNQARARLSSTEAALEKARGPARPAEIRAARARLDQAQASLELAQTRRADARITAPITGTVVATAREAGEFVPAGAPLVELADLSEVKVNIYVTEPRLADLRLDGHAVVAPDGTQERLDGRIAFISPRAEFTPTNVQTDDQRAKLVYRVKIRVSNSEGILKIGMPVEVRIPMEGADRGTDDRR